VYNGDKVHDIFTRRFNLDLDSCKVRLCDLVIRSVQLADAGFFVCFQPSTKNRVAAALVVLGTRARCLLTCSRSAIIINGDGTCRR